MHTVAMAMVLGLGVSCGGVSEYVESSSADGAQTTAVDASTFTVDIAEPVVGVRDRARDPAVVGIYVGGQLTCSGALIASDAVLTSRRCTAQASQTITCPPTGAQVGASRDPHDLRIFVGDDVATGTIVALGREIVAPAGNAVCDHDIAVVLLDRFVQGIAPLRISAALPEVGDHVRSVGYYPPTAETALDGVKLMREHVRITASSGAEFLVAEAGCPPMIGAPAIEESTGYVLGIASRGLCGETEERQIYTRTDAFRGLIDLALAKSGKFEGASDAGAPTKPQGSGKPPTELGEPCTKGTECASGVCVSDAMRAYCTRFCRSNDRCPAGYRCTKATATQSVCTAG